MPNFTVSPEMFEFLREAVCPLYTDENAFHSTAFKLFDRNGSPIFITACHNIHPPSGRLAASQLQDRPFRVVTCGDRVGNDIAVLSATVQESSPTRFEVDSNLVLGKRVLLAGFYWEAIGRDGVLRLTVCPAVIEWVDQIRIGPDAVPHFTIVASSNEPFREGFSGGPVFDPDSQPLRVLGVFSTKRDGGMRGGCISINGLANLAPDPNIALWSSASLANDCWFDPQMPALDSPWQERAVEQPLLTRLMAIEGIVPTRVAFVGLGGVGKTQLARRVVSKWASGLEYVWWLKANSRSTLVADLERLCRLHGIGVDGLGFVSAAINWLRNRRRWLVVLDDLPDADVFRSIFGDERLAGRFVMTSRNPNLSTIAETVEVLPFTTEEALAYMGQRQISGEAVAGLVNSLGQLPLALRQAADYIEATGESATTYTQQLQTKPLPLLSVDLRDATTPTVALVWRTSLTEVVARAPVAKGLLSFLSFLGPYPFPRSLLQRDTIKRIIERLCETSADISDLNLSLAIAAARRFSLVDLVGDSLQMHKLVQLFVRESLDAATRRCETLTIPENFLAMEEFSGDATDPRTLLPIIPHALELLGNVPIERPGELMEIFRVPEINAALALIIMKKMSMKLRDLCEQICDLDLLEESWKQMIRCDRAMKSIGEDGNPLAESLSGYARAIHWYKLGAPTDPRPRELLEEAYALLRTGRNKKAQFVVYANAIDVWRLRGNFPAALKAAARLEKLEKGTNDLPGCMLTMHLRAQIYWDAARQKLAGSPARTALLKKCLKETKRQLALCDGQPEGLHRQRPLALRHVAEILTEIGDADTGRRYMEEAINGLEQLENRSRGETDALFECRRALFDSELKQGRVRPELLADEIHEVRRGRRLADIGFVRALHRRALSHAHDNERTAAVNIETEALQALLQLRGDYVQSDLRGVYVSLLLARESAPGAGISDAEMNQLTEQVRKRVTDAGQNWNEFRSFAGL